MPNLLGNRERWDPHLGRTQRSATGHPVLLLNQSMDLHGCMVQLAPETASGHTVHPVGSGDGHTLMRFFSDGSQFGTDNSRLTIIFSDTMTYQWFSGSRDIILEGSLSRYSAAYRHTIRRLRGEGHVPTIVRDEHHVSPAEWGRC